MTQPEPQPNPEKPVRQILIAGVGNAWLQDDAFGSECARRLDARGVPEGVSVMDVGTGGLDLAYELIRGYDALVLLDASRQGDEPGTLYVMEADRAEFAGDLKDGESIDPHDMNPHTVLRFVNAIGGWPGKVLIIACEPGETEEPGLGLTPPVERAVEGAIALVLETIADLQTDEAYERA